VISNKLVERRRKDLSIDLKEYDQFFNSHILEIYNQQLYCSALLKEANSPARMLSTQDQFKLGFKALQQRKIHKICLESNLAEPLN